MSTGTATLAAKPLPPIRTLRRLRMMTLSFNRLAPANLRLNGIACSRTHVRLWHSGRLLPHIRLAREAWPIRGWIFSGPRSVDGLELAITLNGLIYMFSL